LGFFGSGREEEKAILARAAGGCVV
jgi:hypothetical protein